MLSLELGAYGVVLHDGKLLLRTVEGEAGTLAYAFPGEPIPLGTTQARFVEALLTKQVGCSVRAGKLLYIVERFYQRGREQVHAIASYYQCEPQEPAAEAMTLAVSDEPGPGELALCIPKAMDASHFVPQGLWEVVTADAASEFKVGPKLVVINEGPEFAAAASGVYSL